MNQGEQHHGADPIERAAFDRRRIAHPEPRPRLRERERSVAPIGQVDVREPEHEVLRPVPRTVEGDRQPQRAREPQRDEHRGAKDRDDDEAQREARVERVRAAEEDSDDQRRGPDRKPLADVLKKVAAEEHLLVEADARERHRTERDETDGRRVQWLGLNHVHPAERALHEETAGHHRGATEPADQQPTPHRPIERQRQIAPRGDPRSGEATRRRRRPRSPTPTTARGTARAAAARDAADS